MVTQLCPQINSKYLQLQMFLVQKTEIRDHALPPAPNAPPSNQSGIRCKISSLNSCFRTQTGVLLSGSPGLRGQACPRLPLLSSHGPLASTWPSSAMWPASAPRQAPITKRPPGALPVPLLLQPRDAVSGEPAAHRAHGPWSLPDGRAGGGEGLFPCSICSVKFVKCKESLNSCIFKRENLI